ncbi:MAG: CaiB/BaiF CoA-transferase family protein [Clostridiales bacterium]|nr:CaiB/BaiF CoA-transferase family protein [Clostridiales bacterium]
MSEKITHDITEKPLSGVVVLDLSQAYAGPFCTMHMADMGATVIKLEVPGKGDQSRTWAPVKNGKSGYFSYINRNKFGLSLNLKSEEGKELFKKLVAKADVLVENFRVGTMEKLGVGYDVLKEINPKLIYAQITGFGLEGELASRPCYDPVAQAMGGIMSITGFGDQYTKVGPAIGDSFSGTYMSAAIAMALFQRERTGMGRRIDVSMLDTIFSILDSAVVEYTYGGNVSKPNGNADLSISPFDSFKAKDGMFILACGSDKFFRSFCEVMGQPELAEDPRFVTNSDRVANHNTQLKPIIEAWSVQHTLDELEEAIVGAGIPFGRIQNVKDLCEMETIKQRNMLWEIDDPFLGETITVPGTPIKMHGCEDAPERPAPMLGQHTNEILKENLGLSDEEIAELKKNGII